MRAEHMLRPARQGHNEPSPVAGQFLASLLNASKGDRHSKFLVPQQGVRHIRRGSGLLRSVRSPGSRPAVGPDAEGERPDADGAPETWAGAGQGPAGGCGVPAVPGPGRADYGGERADLSAAPGPAELGKADRRGGTAPGCGDTALGKAERLLRVGRCGGVTYCERYGRQPRTCPAAGHVC